MTRPLFYADLIESVDGVIIVGGSEGRHAVAVRRLRVGEAVDVSDGNGRLAHGSVAATGKDELVVAVESITSLPGPSPRIVVIQALPKGDRAELAVATLTEVGVDEIVPWAAEHCVAKWEAQRRTAGLAKWRNVAREAGKQSRRPRLPVVADLADTAEVVRRLARAGLPVVLHESAQGAINDLAVPDSGDVVIVVGPEGGIAPAELAEFAAIGAAPVRLGPEVLRTSTAGTVAAGVLLARSARWSPANTI